MTTTPKKTTSSAAKKETPAEPTPEKTTRPASPKKYHVLYQPGGAGIGITDVLIYGDRTRAWEDLATTHSGADGWEYVAVEVGSSLTDAIAAKAGA